MAHSDANAHQDLSMRAQERAPYRGLLTPSGRVPNFGRLNNSTFQAGLAVANERIAAFLAASRKVGG